MNYSKEIQEVFDRTKSYAVLFNTVVKNPDGSIENIETLLPQLERDTKTLLDNFSTENEDLMNGCLEVLYEIQKYLQKKQK